MTQTPVEALANCAQQKLSDTAFVVERSQLLAACSALRGIGYEHLCSITAIDWKSSWEVVYHLVRFGSREVVTLKVPLEYHDPQVPSVTPIWPGAGWHERESYDLMGILFIGNADLRRILLPNDFKGHPLRKEVLLEKETLPTIRAGTTMEVRRGDSA
jgi:NADH-quinone oxidoreductase subunit C